MTQFRIARQGQMLCRIVTEDAIFSQAAQALGAYLKKITGAASIPTEAPAAIRFRQAARGLNGFAYRVEGNDLILEAETETTAQYAAYDLLERLAGCRYYTAEVEKVPFDPDLTLEVEDYAADPILQFRENYYRGYGDRTFCAKRKTHPFEEHAGWGFWCHSFHTLVPAEMYFDEHPEYFGMIDGKRDPQAQLCLSNPDLVEVVCQRLAGFIAQQPDKVYWSVSQDDHDRYCQCPACQALNDADGTPMGSILNFVNQVAARFPEKKISTLAYWYSRKAPKVTRPAPNVHIMLCNIEALRGEPLEEDPRCAGTVQELKEWAAICDNIFLWDYNIQFANLVSPFPNLNVLAPNFRFFVENSVRSLFAQCNREIGGDMSDLRGYMAAKLMWNPYDDPRAIMEDFVNGYYGAAGPHILRYLDTLHGASHRVGAPLGIFMGPRDAQESYLTPALVAEYDAAFDAAEAAVADDPALLDRVRIARLSVLYAKIVLKYGTKVQQAADIARFADAARIQGLEKVEEWHKTVDLFVTDSLASLAHERLEFSRGVRPAMELLGVMDKDPEGRGTCMNVMASYRHTLLEVNRWLVLPGTGSSNQILYSLPLNGGRFVGFRLKPLRPAGQLSNSFLQTELPAADCVLVRCELPDLAEARAAVPGYLAEHGLTQKGDILERETLGGVMTLFVPV